MNIAAEAPTNVASGGKKGKLSGKLRQAPKKKAISRLLESLTLSKVFPNTQRKIMFPSRWIRLACTKIAVTTVQTFLLAGS